MTGMDWVTNLIRIEAKLWLLLNPVSCELFELDFDEIIKFL